MLPGVTINRVDGSTGVKPQADASGITAIIAAASGGPQDVATMYTDRLTAYGVYSDGPLVELAGYMLNTAGKPVVLIKGAGSTAGAYGTIDVTGVTGTSVVSSHGANIPLDTFAPWVKIIFGGTVGVAGITYQYSLDGGASWSGTIALGTLNHIDLPNTGIRFDLAAGTLITGDLVKDTTTGPQITSGDLTTALEALRITKLPWETLLIDGVADATMFAAVDTWLAGLELTGQYQIACLNTVFRTAAQTEAQFATALAGVYGSTAGIKEVLCADAVDVISDARKIFMKRPVSLVVCARAMSSDEAVDPAYLGVLPNCTIDDVTSKPKYHDEQLYPGLDDSKFTTLRSKPKKSGAFITNARIFSPAGSDYVYWQQARVMNLANKIAWDTLDAQCSIGVHVLPNPQNKAIKNITPEDAMSLEQLVQTQYDAQLIPKRVSSASFKLSLTDDLSSNGPGTLTGTIQVGALRYVKTFKIATKFV